MAALTYWSFIDRYMAALTYWSFVDRYMVSLIYRSFINRLHVSFDLLVIYLSYIFVLLHKLGCIFRLLLFHEFEQFGSPYVCTKDRYRLQQDSNLV